MTELAPAFTVGPDAMRYARERCIVGALNQLGALTAELIPDARSIRAEFHDDPDVAGLTWISFRVEVGWTDPERVRRVRNGWYERTASEFPPEILANFGLDIDRSAE
jgi:hypothetical protein